MVDLFTSLDWEGKAVVIMLIFCGLWGATLFIADAFGSKDDESN